jgi:4-hydroxyphenylacetate 3-monooxygenase
MPARKGKDYINWIDQLQPNLWIDGKPVKRKISEHAAFKGIMKSQAALYDMQHVTSLKEIMTYLSPTTGQRVGVSYLQLKTTEDLVKRRVMIQQWAKSNNGLMGRSPNYEYRLDGDGIICGFPGRESELFS